MRAFRQLPRRLYAHDPVAVQPLAMLQDFVLERHKHPFYDQGRGASAEFFLAADRATGRIVGRVAAIIDHRQNEHDRLRDPNYEPFGHFGFFECEDHLPDARGLIAAAGDWLRERGMKRMLGPASPSQSYDYGLLIEGYDLPHRFLVPYHPPYYAALLTGCGLTKAKDQFSLTGDLQDPRCREPMKRLAERGAAMAARCKDVTVRPINMRRYAEEARNLGAVFNEVLRDNFGHSPVTEQEWRLITDSVRPIVDPNFVLVAERDGKGVGLMIALPDINEVLGRLRLRFGFLEALEFLVRSWRWKAQCVTVLVAGSTRQGKNFAVTPLLVGQLAHNALAAGIRFVDGHHILEDNLGMLAPVLRHGFVPDRRYRIYQLAL
jgi:hypothetical protein